MLVPAILYKEQIIKGMQKYFYTTDMMYESGHAPHGVPKNVVVTTQLPLFLLLAISTTTTAMAAAVFVHFVF